MAKADPIFATLEAQRRAAAKIEELKYFVGFFTPITDGTLWEKFSETIDAEHNATDNVATLPTTCARLLRLCRDLFASG